MHIRKNQPAFHPGCQQEILAAKSSFVAFRRFNNETGDLVICISNITGHSREIPASLFGQRKKAYRDLLGDQEIVICNGKICLNPYQTLWLKELQNS
jgi:hypothetical protein